MRKFDITPPSKLYRYSEMKWLERSLKLGEFRLRPAADYQAYEVDQARYDDELVRVFKSPAKNVSIKVLESGQYIEPIGEVVYRSEVGTSYLLLCFSERWDELLFDDFAGSDSCLIIHNVSEFTERLHEEVSLILPEWIGFDAPVVYGGCSDFGAVFSKPLQYIVQHEWRFSWRPKAPLAKVEPVTVRIGDISDIAELVQKP